MKNERRYATESGGARYQIWPKYIPAYSSQTRCCLRRWHLWSDVHSGNNESTAGPERLHDKTPNEGLKSLL